MHFLGLGARHSQCQLLARLLHGCLFDCTMRAEVYMAGHVLSYARLNLPKTGQSQLIHRFQHCLECIQSACAAGTASF